MSCCFRFGSLAIITIATWEYFAKFCVFSSFNFKLLVQQSLSLSLTFSTWCPLRNYMLSLICAVCFLSCIFYSKWYALLLRMTLVKIIHHNLIANLSTWLQSWFMKVNRINCDFLESHASLPKRYNHHTVVELHLPPKEHSGS